MRKRSPVLRLLGALGRVGLSKIAILSSVRWSFTWQRHHAVAAALVGRGHDVWFVEPPLRSVVHPVRAALTQISRGAARANTPEYRVRKRAGVQVDTSMRWADIAPRHLTRGTTEQAQRKLATMDAVILYLPSPSFLRLCEATKVPAIYDRVVEWERAPERWRPLEWRAVEDEIYARVPERFHLVTDSRLVRGRLASLGLDCQVVAPAVDPWFVGASEMADPPEDGPVGYFGHIRPEVDLQLLSQLAKRTPVEVLGPADRSTVRKLQRSGISYRGVVPPTELPRAMASWRGQVLAYRGSRAGSIVPAKIWNAISLGVPVFARGIDTPLEVSEAVMTLPPDDRAAAADVLSRLADPVRRSSPPPMPTWEDRVREMLVKVGLDL